jgi:hypothetical protein
MVSFLTEVRAVKPLLASIRSVTLHEPLDRATNRVPAVRHDPFTDQRFVPVELVVTRPDNFTELFGSRVDDFHTINGVRGAASA